MFFDIKNTVGEKDVPLALVEPVDIRSQDVILGYDVSAAIPGNPSPAIGFIQSNTKHFEGITELDIKSPFSNIDLTDVYFYDQKLKSELPLWFKHTLNVSVFNRTATEGKYTQKNIPGKVTIQALAPAERIITYRSEKLHRILPSGSRANIIEYYLNYISRTLTLNLGVLFDLEVTFETLLNNIEISQSDRSRYAIQYEKAAPDEYICTIYTESSAPLDVVYSHKLPNGDTERITERTNPTRIYQRIEEQFIGDTDNNEKNVFAVVPFMDNNFRVISSQSKNNENIFKKFSFRQRDNVYTKLFLSKPLNASTLIPWRIILEGNSYVYRDKLNHITYSFTPPELTQGRTIDKVEETGEYINKNEVRITKRPLWEIDRDGNVVGIEAFEETSNAPIEIVGVSTEEKIVRFKQDLGLNNRVRVSYRTLDKRILIENNVNPIIDPTAFNFYHIYYIVPSEYLKANSTRSIFVHRLSRFNNGTQLIWASRDFLQYFAINRASILEEVKSYLNVPASHATAFPMGIFYVDTPVDEDFITMYDSRVRGGGFIKEYEYCGDWTYWNGEAIDISGRLLIRIKQSIWDNLFDRYMANDEDTLRSPNPKATATEKTNNHIRATVERHTREGFHFEIELEPDV